MSATRARGLDRLLADCRRGLRPGENDAVALLADAPLEAIGPVAAALALEGHGRVLSHSRKVFVPLTQLCRDVCHYCTFAKAPKRLADPYLPVERVVERARAGAARRCKEALFTLGDKPELRYRAARDALDALGYGSTVDYLRAMATREPERQLAGAG